MASPVFDKEQYELRGHLPTPMTEAQREALNLVLSRVNGQIDWNAQLLGFNGENYWGKRIPTNDGSYKWKGLPETVSEKRAVQTGAFGIYNKDKDYSNRPAPFNRSKVGASADAIFDIFEENGRTRVVPFGQPRDLLYEETPRLITGGEYTFNALVHVQANTETTEWLYVVQDLDQGITSVRLLGEGAESEAITVGISGSSAEPFLFFLATWEDISDWTSEQILNQFIGLWGNKGNAIASHFLFDALNVHGFNEEEALSLDDILEEITITDLLNLVGLKPGPATPFITDHYNFLVEGCEDFYQPTVSLETKITRIQTENYETLVTENGFEISEDDGACAILAPPGILLETDGPDEPTTIIDNGTFEDIIAPVDTLNNGEYPGVSFSTVSDDGIFGQQPAELLTESLDLLAINDPSYDNSACYLPPDPEFGTCDTPNYTLTLRQFFDTDPNEIAVDPGPETSNAIGCNGVQFLFPPTCFIDNAEYPAVLGQFYLDGGDYDFPVLPTSGVGDGIYDRDPFSVCDGLPEDYERIIEGDDLVVDVAGEAGPILMSDPGVDNEIVLAATDNFGEYDGFIIAFDGLELETVSFEYQPKTTYGETRFPCVEWVFDPTLDNATYFPTPPEAAWMGTDDGEYDRQRERVPIASQSDVPCIGNLTFVGGFLSFDDGAFDEIVEPNCDYIDPTPVNCREVDGGFYQLGINPLTPPQSNTECGAECGTVDGGIYVYGQPLDELALIDGGVLDTCTIYDNTEYDLVQPGPLVSCIAYDNESYSSPGTPIECIVTDNSTFIPTPYAEPPIDDGFYNTQTIVEIIILSTESGLEITSENNDPIGFDPAIIIPVTDPLICTSCSGDAPEPIIVDCVLNNGIFEAPGPPQGFVNDGFYDRDPNSYCVPCQDPNAPVIPCPVEMLRVRLDQIIFSAPRWRMRPSVMNSQTPLRLWKNRVLNVADPVADNAYVNSLVADQNTGAESPFAYRHFARLPVEYQRNGKFWNRTESVLANESYFSRALPPSQTQLPIIDEKPLLYDEVYQLGEDLLPDDATFYSEDYLISTIRPDDEIIEDGFIAANEVFEEIGAALPYVSATVLEYDAYESRLLNADGTRVGKYLKWNRRDRRLTGYLEVDVNDFALRYATATEPTISDASTILIPNIEFPDDPDQASFANYSVCYAYFVADLSAGDDPVFDPTSFFCHRSESIDNVEIIIDELATQENTPILTEDFEFIDPFGLERSVNDLIRTNTRYILHN